MRDKISITIEKNLIKEVDSIVDNIYIRNRSQAIEHLVKKALGENKTAVILSGGPKESLKLKNTYRPLAIINNKTVVEQAVQKLRENGFKNIFVIARHDVVTKIFEVLGNGSDYGVKVEYIEEKVSKGTADSLRLLKGKINSNFIVVYGDIIFKKINIEELWNHHLKQKAIATLMLTTSATPSMKGIVKVEGTKILDFTQKPKETDIYLGFSSLFVCSPDILDIQGQSLEDNVFPHLAKNQVLQGHLSSEKEYHIHSEKDIKNYK